MAQQMICDGCNQLPGILMITNLENGNVLALCPPCSGIWAEAHHAAMAEAFPGQVNAPDTGPEGAESTGAATGAAETAEEAHNGDLRGRGDGIPGEGAPGADPLGADQPGPDPAGGPGEGRDGRHESDGTVHLGPDDADELTLSE